jgi:4-hydroxybenzoate polyprenyltransferase
MLTAAPTSPLRSSWGDKCRAFARDIKISHTLFALPWALLATFLAADPLPHHLPYAGQIALILLCMVTARTVAMAMNRLLDAPLDAVNPRTQGRALPAGRLSKRFVLGAIILCVVGFIAGTLGFWFVYQNPWPPILALPVLAFLSAYPLLKRFTRLCHYYLGMALALAPLCAWLAIRGTLDWPPLIMFAAVLTWTAGFDILYACQDYDSDRQTGVHSVPAKVGIPRALWIARGTHAFSAAMIFLLGIVSPPLATLYFIGAALAALLLIVEHLLVKPTDLSKLNLAFFTLNGVLSVLLATLGILDLFF